MVLDDSREGPTDLTRDVDDVDTWNYLYYIYLSIYVDIYIYILNIYIILYSIL